MIAHLINRRVFDQTTAVRDALEDLELAGCKVLDIRLGGCRPVIFVEPDAAAQQLEGAMYLRERVRGRLVATYVTVVRGCQVRWQAQLPTAPPSNILRLPPPGRGPEVAA